MQSWQTSKPQKYRFVAGPNYAFSSDGLQIIENTKSQHHYDVTAVTNAIPSSGVHHLKFKIVNSQNGYIFVGVCPSSINQRNLNNYERCGWYLSCWNELLFSGQPQKASGESYEPKIRGRESEEEFMLSSRPKEVGVKVDMTNGWISFTVDGVDRGIAYRKVPVNQRLYFCVLLLDQGDSVSIVD
jgi:hypothetical protein